MEKELLRNNGLNEILENHEHWLREDCEGWENMKADLRNANLSDANLRGANLYNADLSGADLRGANLSDANLSDANLYNADLSDANLSDANLYNADLSGADLRGADLRGANLRDANLSDAYLDDSEKIRRGIILSEPMIGWKKCKEDVIVKLEIPKGAIVFSINNSKCRTNHAIVKEIFGSDRAYSNYQYFSYYVGDEINVYDFNCKYNVECGEGIHFFRTREEAEDY